MALSYRQVKDLYDLLHGAGIAQQTLPEWAAEQNRINENDAYAAGLNDNWIKRSSVAIDRGLEWTGAPQATEAFGRSVGELVGNPEAGAAIGQSMPRTMVDFAPMTAGVLLAPFTGGASVGAGLGLSAALSGVNTYTATDSPAAGLISAGTALAMPGVAKASEQLALRALGAPLVKGQVLSGAGPLTKRTALQTISEYYPQNIRQGLAAEAAGQAGASVFGTGLNLSQQVFSGEPLHFSPTEELLNMTLGQVPFAGMYLTAHGRAGLGGKTTQKIRAEREGAIRLTELELTRRKVEKALQEAPSVTKLPDVVEATNIQHLKNVNRLNQIMDLKVAAKKENTPASIEELQRLRDEEQKIIDEQRVLGVEVRPTLTPETERVKVRGEIVRENEAKTWKLIKVADDDPSEFAGKWVSYSTKYAKDEQTPEGAVLFDLPKSSNYHTIWEPDIEKSKEYKSKKQRALEANPELPQNETLTTRDMYFDHVAKLREIDMNLEHAVDTEDFHKAKQDFNQVLAQMGYYDEYTDEQLLLRAKRLKLTSEKEALRSAMNEFAKTKANESAKLEANLQKLGDWTKLAAEDNTAKAVVALHKEYDGSSDRRFNIVHSGLFFDYVDKWIKAGGKSDDGEIPDSLRQKFALAISKGEKLKGNNQKADLTKIESADPVVAEPLKLTLLEAARKMLDEQENILNDTMEALELELASPKPDLDVIKDLMREAGSGSRETYANEKLSNESEARAWNNKKMAPGRKFPIEGTSFHWGFGGLENEKLGGVHVLPKNGLLSEAKFQNMSGEGGGAVQKPLMELAKQLVPEAFKNGMVDVRMFYDKLAKVEPVVKVATYGQDGAPKTQAQQEVLNIENEHAAIAHELDSLVSMQQREAIERKLTEDRWFTVSPEQYREEALQAVPELTKAQLDKLEQSRQILIRLDKATNKLTEAERDFSNAGPRATSYYNQISPFDTKKYPVIRIDVALPGVTVKKGVDATGFPTNEREGTTLWREDNLHENLPNTLGWAMVQIVPGPDGKKVMFVGEQQSRWGQERNRYSIKQLENGRFQVWYTETGGRKIDKGSYSSKESAQRQVDDIAPANHPLLDIQHQLVLKAVIAKAKKQGIEKVVISGGESAMITERHDQAAQKKYEVPANEKNVTFAQQLVAEDNLNYLWEDNIKKLAAGESLLLEDFTGIVQGLEGLDYNIVRKPEQEGGMRNHYDTVLPLAMERLTGQKGELWDGGVHKNTRRDGVIEKSFATKEEADAFMASLKPEQRAYLEEPYKQPGAGAPDLNLFTTKENPYTVSYNELGSPVFKNPDGTPMTNVTGLAYNLSGTPASFTIANPRKAPAKPYVTGNQKELALISAVGKTGRSAVAYLKQVKDIDPAVRALLPILEKYGDALDRIDVEFINQEGASYALNSESTYRTKVGLASYIFSMEPLTRSAEIAHEIVHGLTEQELVKPENIAYVEALTDLRQRMIKRLTPEQQKILAKAEKSNFYERWSRGEVKYDEFEKEFGTVGDDTTFLYAFLTNSEFLAQSFTDGDHRNFMKSQKSKDGTFFSEFTGWIKKLLGVDSKDTALDEVMELSGKIMSKQNAVASVYTYAENHYKSQGQSEAFAQSQAARVAGFIASGGIIKSREDAFRVLAVQEHENVALAAATQQAMDLWRTPNDDTEMVNLLLSELGLEESLVGLEAATVLALRGHRKTRETINFLPEAARGYLLERAKDTNDVLGVVTNITGTEAKKFVNAFDTEDVRKYAFEARRGAMAVAAYDVEMREITNKVIAGAAATSPDGYLEHVVSAPGKPRLVPIEQDTTPKLSWIEKFLARPAQIARMYPEVAEAVTKGYQLLSQARNSALQGFKAFGYDLTTGNLTKEAVETLHKAIANKRISRAVDQWIYLNQKKGGDAIVTLPESDPDVAAVLKGLNANEVTSVKQLIMQKEISQREMNRQALEHMKSIGITNGATLIASKTGFTLQQNVEFMNTVMEFCLADLSDPSVAMQARAELDAIQRKVQPDVFVAAMKFARIEAMKYKEWAAQFEANPAWSTAQRYGKMVASFTDGTTAGVDSKAEALLLAKENKTQLAGLERKGNADDAPHFGAGAESFIARLQELDQNQRDMMAHVLEPEQLEMMKRTSAVEQFAVEARAAGVKGVSAHARRLTKGAERLPFLSNHFSWITKNSTYWARQKYQAEIRLLLLDSQLEGRSDLKDWIRSHAENVLRPDPEGARVATAVTTNWLLGFNAASALANGSQLLLRGAAEMTALTGKPIESFGRIASAFKEMAQQGRGKNWATKEHQWLIERATRDGERNLSLHDIEQAANDTIATNMKRAIAKHGPQTVGQHLSSMAGGYSTAAMWMFRQVEQINNTGALLAGFDYWREQGLGMEEAYKKAAEFNHMVNDVGGKVNRSVGLHSGKDVFSKSAAMIANSMQSYVLGSTFQLVHYIKKGFFRPPGLTPAEIHAARVAAVQMLSVQFAAAGMLGLPFAASAVAILDKAFPDLEVNKNLREWTARLLGNDAENDNMLGDIALTGLPSMFGWDWQSRLSAGNTVPGVSEMNGFQPGLLLGAPASVVTNFVTGTTKLASGDMSGARNFVPPGFRKLLDLGVSGGQALDYKGRPIMTPTAGEKLGMALGFQPKRVSDFNAAARMAVQAEKVAARQRSEETQRLAQKVMKGEFGVVKQELLAKMRQDKNFDAKSAVREISRVAEELTFPRDLRREGGATDRSLLMDAFNVPVGKATEETRLMFRQQIEANLGLRPTQGAAVQMARLMDQLKAQMPDASRTELRRAAELALRGRQTQPSLPE